MSDMFHMFTIELDDGRKFSLGIDLAAESPCVAVTICPPADGGLIKWIHHEPHNTRGDYERHRVKLA